LVGKASADLNLEAEVIAELNFDIPKTMKFHKEKSVDVKVDLIRYVQKI